MEPFGSYALGTALIASTLLAVRATRKKTLTRAGSITGFVVGFLLVSTGMRGMILFYFYQLGSMATKYKKSIKSHKDATILHSAVRGSGQVLSVSALATILSLWHAMQYGAERPIRFDNNDSTSNGNENAAASCVTCGILAHHATSLADTLASEMGILAARSPVLITRPWKKVPAGTNGGITVNGLFWSLVGGVLIGMFYVLTDYAMGTMPIKAVATISFGGLCGLLGSLLDSILGALLQATYYDTDEKKIYHADGAARRTGKNALKLICGVNLLTNEQVNLVSIALTTYIGGWIVGPWLYSQF